MLIPCRRCTTLGYPWNPLSIRPIGRGTTVERPKRHFEVADAALSAFSCNATRHCNGHCKRRTGNRAKFILLG